MNFRILNFWRSVTTELCFIPFSLKIESTICGKEVTITVKDYGKGIDNIDQAREPLYTSRPDLERSGMGFTVMESFMDTLEVESERGKGTKITMTKKFS